MAHTQRKEEAAAGFRDGEQGLRRRGKRGRADRGAVQTGSLLLEPRPLTQEAGDESDDPRQGSRQVSPSALARGQPAGTHCRC